ncbi:MAG TPA: transposase [Panacibacter sp.]|nr:transposase [Panacibacter sp.]
MDLKEQIIAEYLTQGGGFRKLASKYGISRTTICKWVLIHQQTQTLFVGFKLHQLFLSF